MRIELKTKKKQHKNPNQTWSSCQDSSICLQGGCIYQLKRGQLFTWLALWGSCWEKWWLWSSAVSRETPFHFYWFVYSSLGAFIYMCGRFAEWRWKPKRCKLWIRARESSMHLASAHFSLWFMSVAQHHGGQPACEFKPHHSISITSFYPSTFLFITCKLKQSNNQVIASLLSKSFSLENIFRGCHVAEASAVVLLLPDLVVSSQSDDCWLLEQIAAK